MHDPGRCSFPSHPVTTRSHKFPNWGWWRNILRLHVTIFRNYKSLFYATAQKKTRVLSKKCESITNKKKNELASSKAGNHLLLTILLQFQWLRLLLVFCCCFMLRIMIIKNECKCTSMLNFFRYFSTSSSPASCALLQRTSKSKTFRCRSKERKSEKTFPQY